MKDLRKGDCLEVMKDIPDGSFDMILRDLPRNILQSVCGAKMDEKTEEKK